jgi:hypothetical protein
MKKGAAGKAAPSCVWRLARDFTPEPGRTFADRALGRPNSQFPGKHEYPPPAYRPALAVGSKLCPIKIHERVPGLHTSR